MSKPVVSCLWGCGESVNPPELKVQGALSSRPKGDPGPLPIFQDFFIVSNHTSEMFTHTIILFSILAMYYRCFDLFSARYHFSLSRVSGCRGMGRCEVGTSEPAIMHLMIS